MEKSELCLQEGVARLHEAGFSEEEIAHKMGVDPGWVASITAMLAPEAGESGQG